MELMLALKKSLQNLLVVVVVNTLMPSVSLAANVSLSLPNPHPTTPAPGTPSTPIIDPQTKTPLTNQPAATAASIGQVIWVKGSVTAKQPLGTSRALARRSDIFEHDELSSAQNSNGQIGFSDGSTLALTAGSIIRVDSYFYKKGSPKESRSVMNIVTGGFRTITGAVAKDNPQGYSIKTPVATIGVRGTEYSGYFSKDRGLLLSVESGQIEVQNAIGSLMLQKCLGTSTGCQQFGEVNSANKLPTALAYRPTELSHPITLQAVPANIVTAPSRSGGGKPPISPSGTPTGGTGSGATPASSPSGGSKTGPSKTVSNFCVG